MAAVPALLKAFSRSERFAEDGSYAQWHVYTKGDDLEGELEVYYHDAKKYKWFYGGKRLDFYATYPAPLCSDMLRFLNRRGHLSMDTAKACDPDALARACIGASRRES